MKIISDVCNKNTLVTGEDAFDEPIVWSQWNKKINTSMPINKLTI
jgi:hypothetical protein